MQNDNEILMRSSKKLVRLHKESLPVLAVREDSEGERITSNKSKRIKWTPKIGYQKCVRIFLTDMDPDVYARKSARNIAAAQKSIVCAADSCEDKTVCVNLFGVRFQTLDTNRRSQEEPVHTFEGVPKRK